MQPEHGAVEPAFRFMTWDWKDQPDLQELATLVNQVSGGRKIFFTEADTGGDAFAIVVSDVELSKEEATAWMNKQYE